MLKDGYTTTGGNPSTALGDYSAGMAFYGPGGVGAMAETQDAFVKMAYSGLVNQTTGGAMNVSGVFTYYNASWGVLSLLAMSGNFWDMAPYVRGAEGAAPRDEFAVDAARLTAHRRRCSSLRLALGYFV